MWKSPYLLDTQQIQQVPHVAQNAANLLHLPGILRWAIHQAIQQAYKIEKQLPVQRTELFPEICRSPGQNGCRS